MKESFSSGIKALMIIVAMSALSCEPLYIPDPIDPRLPKYTQSGNNVAGALVNDELWKAEYYRHTFFGHPGEPLISYSSNSDSLSIQFLGVIGDEKTSSYLTFGLKKTLVNSLSSMTNLEGRKFELGNGENVVSIDLPSQCNAPGTGQLYFRSVKYRPAKNLVTFSGTFGFNMTDPACGTTEVTYGRFDMIVYYVSMN